MRYVKHAIEAIEQETRYALQTFERETKKLLRRYIKVILIILASLGILFFFKKVLIMAVFLAINAVVALIWMYFHNRIIAIEFITLTSLICLYAFGVKAGVFFMLLSILLHNFITTNMSMNNLLNIFLSPFILWLLSFFSGMGIVAMALWHVVIVNVLFFILVLLLHTGRMHKRIIYLVTHIAWTWFLFRNFAEPVLGLFV